MHYSINQNVTLEWTNGKIINKMLLIENQSESNLAGKHKNKHLPTYYIIKQKQKKHNSSLLLLIISRRNQSKEHSSYKGLRVEEGDELSNHCHLGGLDRLHPRWSSNQQEVGETPANWVTAHPFTCWCGQRELTPLHRTVQRTVTLSSTCIDSRKKIVRDRVWESWMSWRLSHTKLRKGHT